MNSTQTDQSIYQALSASAPEIRVITLRQGSADEELRCTLKTVSLDDQPSFHALSYAWGTDTEKCRININGHVVPVSSSLATVLRHFHSHHYDFLQLHSVPLWVDAICINQADLDERARQVRIMGRIYRQASRVLLWIGEGDEFSDHAIDRMNDTTFRASCEELETTSREPTMNEVRVKMIILHNLEQRQYWTRVWILQEVLLATEDPIIVCGTKRLLWSWYTQCKGALPKDQSSYPSLAFNWAALVDQVPYHHDLAPSDHSSAGSLAHETMRTMYQQSGVLPFGVALAATIHLDATDPRDRIYGILGLLSHRDMLMVDVDYKKTPEQVSRDTMIALWSSGMHPLVSLVMPSLLSASWEADDNSKAPSWSPNVLKERKKDSDDMPGLDDHRLWHTETRVQVHVDGSILTIKAIRFDSIEDTVQMDFDHWNEMVRSWEGPGEGKLEPLQNIEAMAQRGLNIPIPASSRLATLSALRNKLPIWSALTYWGDEDNDGWLPGIERDKQKLWEILLGREEIPEHWKMAGPPELQEHSLAVEAAILLPIRRAVSKKVDDRKVFISQSGFLGVGTKSVEVGDIITVIMGMAVMFVLRPFQDGYRIVGFANVSGLMDWDVWNEALEAGSLHEEEMKIY